MSKITKWHRHELMDRIYCMYDSFNNLIADHTAASKMQEDIDIASQVLFDLYQKAGELALVNRKIKC